MTNVHPSENREDWLEQALRLAFGSHASAEVAATWALDVQMTQAAGASAAAADADACIGDDAPLLLPEEGRYELLGEAGRGGLGIVYRGHDRDLDREVAVKSLDHRLAADPAFVRRFVAEAQLCARLQHPGIVPVHEIGLDAAQRPYFVMRLIAGETFAEVLLRRQDVSADRHRCLDVFQRICQAVAFAHEQGVVHADLKPANVMLGSHGEVQVVDWGLARSLPEVPPARRPTAADKGEAETRPDSVMGTPGYMAPEQARGGPEGADARSDVFALGAMLAEILTGHPAHRCEVARGEQVARTAQGQLDEVMARLAAPDVDPDLAELACACLAASPDDRPISAHPVAQRIGDHLSALAERTRKAQLQAAGARTRTRAVVAVAVALCVIVWLVFDRDLAEQKRRSVSTLRVEQMLSEVVRLVERARAGGDAGLWDQADAAAGQAEQLAAALPVTEATTRRVAAVRCEVDAARALEAERLDKQRREVRLIDQLEDARLPRTELGDARRWRWRDDQSRRALREFLGGQEPLALPVGTLLERLRGGVDAPLAMELDLWVLARMQMHSRETGFAERTGLIHDVAVGLDTGDDVRGLLRSAVLAGDAVEIVALGKRVAPTQLEVRSGLLLVEALAAHDRIDEALALSRSLAVSHPREIGFHLALDSLYERQQRPGDALAHLRAAGALRPDHSGIPFRMGLHLTALGDHEQAALCFERSLHLSRGDIGMFAQLVYATVRCGRPEEARARMDAYLGRLDRRHLDVIGLRILSLLLNDMKNPGADRCIAELIRRSPLDAEGLRLAGERLAQGGNHRAALRFYERASSAGSPVPDLLELGIARSSRELGRIAVAAAAVDRALAQGGRKHAQLHELALIRYHQGRLEDCVAAGAEAIAAGCSCLDLRNALGFACAGLGRGEQALSYWEPVVRACPDIPDILRAVALVKLDVGDAQGALELLRRCEPLAPQDVNVKGLTGMALARLGDLAGAETNLRAVVVRERRVPQWGIELGRLLIDLRRFDEALACLDRAIAIDAKDREARQMRASCLTELGRWVEAGAVLEQLLAEAPDDAAVLRASVIVHSVLGQKAAARLAFLRAALIDPGQASELRAWAEDRCATDEIAAATWMLGLLQEFLSLRPTTELAELRAATAELAARVDGRARELLAAAAGNVEAPAAEVLRGADLLLEEGHCLAAVAAYRRGLSLTVGPDLDAQAFHCAARAAALASASPELRADPQQGEALRAQAKAWLREARSLLGRPLVPGAAAAIAVWRADAWLGAIRDEAALVLLPTTEADELRAFWKQVMDVRGEGD